MNKIKTPVIIQVNGVTTPYIIAEAHAIAMAANIKKFIAKKKCDSLADENTKKRSGA